MNRFCQNRTAFLIVTGASCVLGIAWVVFRAKADWNDASIRFNQASAELNRLERLTPYPSEDNLRQTKLDVDEYGAAVARLKSELGERVAPLAQLAPNEFQSHLRVAMAAVTEKARVKGVRLPDKFHLGFDEFVSALPSDVAAPLLGQELTQVEWILNTLIEAHVDSLVSFRRVPLPEEHGPTASGLAPISARPKPRTSASALSRVIERSVVEATFLSTPEAMRKVLNQVAGANEQFFIVRLLHVRNEQGQGPSREVAMGGGGSEQTARSAIAADSPGPKSSAAPALNFIVGNERIETSARIEIVRFRF